LTTFNDLGLAEPILKAVSAVGYTKPTPIQEQAIPPLMKRRDVVGIAQTGTGKTASFVLPLLHQIIERKSRCMPRMCSALILSPTRELASQIVDNIKNYSTFTKIKAALIVGGVSPKSQIQALNNGADIVVATPGRLLDHINSGAIMLFKTDTLVIDEADQMLDLGFLPDIRRIVEKLSANRQTALLSATMPTQIRKLADDLLTMPAEIKVAAVSRPVERIAQSVQHVAKTDKPRILNEILSTKDVERAIVFTRTKRGADRVCKHLISANLNAASIHGDKSQGQRNRAMDAFRAGETSILVATDVAARGIDIDDISHVVNFEIPNAPESYVHRIGRTARAGRSGIAISLCDPSEASLLKNIEKLIGNKLQCASAEGGQTNLQHSETKHSNMSTVNRENTRNQKRDKDTVSTVPRRNARDEKKPIFKTPGPDQPIDGLMRMFANIGTPQTTAA
jgi:ATP-dependent RNA helicase RhlE